MVWRTPRLFFLKPNVVMEIPSHKKNIAHCFKRSIVNVSSQIELNTNRNSAHIHNGVVITLQIPQRLIW